MTKFFQHPNALVESKAIGKNSRIWAFSHVLEGANIGEDCNICDHVFIENDVILGDRVTVKSGVQLWGGLRIGDDVFIGPNATFTNDRMPRSKQYPEKFIPTNIEDGASIGANATILPGITIGKKAMIGAGSVVTRDVPPNAVVTGNPARVTGYIDVIKGNEPSKNVSDTRGVFPESGKKIGQIIDLPIITDSRGSLSFAEINQSLPFQPNRYFVIFDVPHQEVRGEHAHKKLSEFLVCIKGSCNVLIDDGYNREEYVLSSPSKGFLISPMIWTVQYKYSSDAILLVLASDVYESEDYIRDYDEFLSMVQKT
jgi:acetyltransferase-like isoleucine patch superfamily enzyme